MKRGPARQPLVLIELRLFSGGNFLQDAGFETCVLPDGHCINAPVHDGRACLGMGTPFLPAIAYVASLKTLQMSAIGFRQLTGDLVVADSELGPFARRWGRGTRVALTTLDAKETSHRGPEFLPDGNHFLYFAHGSTTPDNNLKRG